MIPPAGMAIAALTVMLWILWSDTVRRKRPTPILYAVRVGLYLTMAAVLIIHRMRYPRLFSTTANVLVGLAVAVGVGGAVYFGRKVIRRGA